MEKETNPQWELERFILFFQELIEHINEKVRKDIEDYK